MRHQLDKSEINRVLCCNQLLEAKVRADRNLPHLLECEKIIVADEVTSKGVIVYRGVSVHFLFGVTAPGNDWVLCAGILPSSKCGSAIVRCVYRSLVCEGILRLRYLQNQPSLELLYDCKRFLVDLLY